MKINSPQALILLKEGNARFVSGNLAPKDHYAEDRLKLSQGQHPFAEQVEKKLAGIKDPIDVAVMGCVVNGPGEARGADVGIAGGNGEGLIFRKGEIIRKVPEDKLVEELFKEIDAILEERKNNASK